MGESMDSTWPPTIDAGAKRVQPMAGSAVATGLADDWLSAQPAVRWRELLAVVSAIALADLTIYRGHGYAGVALLLAAAPGILLLGSPRRRVSAVFWALAAMLGALAVRMLWQGSPLEVAAGFALVASCAVSLDGRRPHVLDIVLDVLFVLLAGLHGLLAYGAAVSKSRPRISWLVGFGLLLPAGAVVVYGALFVLANPNLADWVSQGFDRLIVRWERLLATFDIHFAEVIFWIVVGCVTIGLLRPLGGWLLDITFAQVPVRQQGAGGGAGQPSLLYRPLFNMLLAVIALFAIYLAFEFATLWFRTFPAGFHYSGYAHEGAAWLTVALALSTVVLSLVFQGDLLDDPRVGRLRRLAWIWSAENLLLALSVYHRMLIYIDFNGMTRLRSVGLFGISTVVVGFLLVMWKIRKQHSFVWLIRGQLGALALAVYLFALTPVDALVHRYNVGRILAGDPAPAVQITEHPVDAEGVLMTHPLVRSSDAVIREGIRAMLAQRAVDYGLDATADADHTGSALPHWTAWQGADAALRRELLRVRADWAPYLDADQRTRALERFREYAYQWY